jgi:hypothetical protein
MTRRPGKGGDVKHRRPNGSDPTMQTSNRSRHDVVVVGRGRRVAGAATAMLLARLGHDVALVDQASFPSDTLPPDPTLPTRTADTQRRPPRGFRELIKPQHRHHRSTHTQGDLPG